MAQDQISSYILISFHFSGGKKGGKQIQLFQQQNVGQFTLLSDQGKGNKKHVCWIDLVCNHLLDHCLIQQF